MKKLLTYTALIVLWGASGNALKFRNMTDIENVEYQIQVRNPKANTFSKVVPGISLDQKESMEESLLTRIEKAKTWFPNAETMRILTVTEGIQRSSSVCKDAQGKPFVIDISGDINSDAFKQKIEELDGKTITFSIPEGKKWWDAVVTID